MDQVAPGRNRHGPADGVRPAPFVLIPSRSPTNPFAPASLRQALTLSKGERRRATPPSIAAKRRWQILWSRPATHSLTGQRRRIPWRGANSHEFRL